MSGANFWTIGATESMPKGISDARTSWEGLLQYHTKWQPTYTELASKIRRGVRCPGLSQIRWCGAL